MQKQQQVTLIKAKPGSAPSLYARAKHLRPFASEKPLGIGHSVTLACVAVNALKAIPRPVPRRKSQPQRLWPARVGFRGRCQFRK